MKWMVLEGVLLSACASHDGAGDTTGGLQHSDDDVPSLPGEKCGAEAACSNSTSKSYRQCQAPGPPCVARFITSDGQTFNCVSCSDCMAAAGLVTDWCGP